MAVEAVVGFAAAGAAVLEGRWKQAAVVAAVGFAAPAVVALVEWQSAVFLSRPVQPLGRLGNLYRRPHDPAHSWRSKHRFAP